jgi:hypothetical protein
MSTTQAIAVASAFAALLSVFVAFYVAYRQRTLNVMLSNRERAYELENTRQDSVRSCMSAAFLVSYRAMELRKLVPFAIANGPVGSPAIEQRFTAFTVATDQFIEAWARAGSRADSLINSDCENMALQLIESVESVRLAWIMKTSGFSDANTGLSEAVENVIMAGQGCAAALSSTVASRLS